MRRSMVAIVVTMLAVIGCKGADGAVGPAGPQGEQGPQGAPAPAGATQYTVTGTIASDGTAGAVLPSAVANAPDLPTLACYISEDRATWLAVSTDTNGTDAMACGLNKDSSGMTVVLIGAPAGWFYYFAVTYVPAS